MGSTACPAGRHTISLPGDGLPASLPGDGLPAVTGRPCRESWARKGPPSVQRRCRSRTVAGWALAMARGRMDGTGCPVSRTSRRALFDRRGELTGWPTIEGQLPAVFAAPGDPCAKRPGFGRGFAGTGSRLRPCTGRMRRSGQFVRDRIPPREALPVALGRRSGRTGGLRETFIRKRCYRRPEIRTVYAVSAIEFAVTASGTFGSDGPVSGWRGCKGPIEESHDSARSVLHVCRVQGDRCQGCRRWSCNLGRCLHFGAAAAACPDCDSLQ